MKDYGARLTLNTQNFYAGISTSVKMLSNFQKDVKAAKKNLKEMEKQRIETRFAANTKEINKRVEEVKNKLKPFRQAIVQNLAAKDLASEKIRSIRYKLSGIHNQTFGPVIRAKDNITGFITNINEHLFNLRNAAITVAIGYGIKNSIDEVALTQTAQGQVKSLGVDDGGIEILTKKAIAFANEWSGTTRSEFIAASYDIKSGISSLANQGIADFTYLAALTGKATKSTVNEMTTLFSQGYGIYRDLYKNDFDFGEKFAAGIAKSVQLFRTTGSEMSQYLSALGANAKAAGASTDEIFAIGGMLQATMTGSEAATKYRSFITTAVEASEKLGLKFVDNNKKLLPTAEIIDLIKKKYGETLDAVESKALQDAFGTEEASAFIKMLYSQTNEIRNQQRQINASMNQGTETIKAMAQAMNEGVGEKILLLKQRWGNLKYEFGKKIAPEVGPSIDKLGETMLSISKSNSFNSFSDAFASGIKKSITTVNSFMTYIKNNPKAVSDAWNGIKGVFQGIGQAITFIGKLAKPVFDYIQNNPEKASKTIKNLILTILGFKVAGFAFAGFFKALDTLSSLKSKVTLVRSLVQAAGGLNGVFNMLNAGLGRVGNVFFRAITFIVNMGFKGFGMLGGFIRTFVTGGIGILTKLFTFLMANPMVLIITGIIAAVILLHQAWKNNWFGIRDIVANVWEKIKTGSAKAINGLIDMLNVFIKGINKIPGVEIPLLMQPKWATEQIKNSTQRRETGFQQHAVGLPRVPYDNYPAMLHEGEMVLTKGEVNQYRLQRNNTINDQTKELYQNVKQRIVQRYETVKISQPKDLIQNIYQNLIATKENKPKELIQNMKQVTQVSKEQKPKSMIQEIRQQLFPAKPIKLSDITQNIYQKLIKSKDDVPVSRKYKTILEKNNDDNQEFYKSNGSTRSVKFDRLLDKLADTIIIREEADIEKLGDMLDRKLVETSLNMA